MKFTLLGTVTVGDGATATSPRRALHRGLLALLLLHQPAQVSATAAREALWGGCPPASGRKQVPNAVHYLRTVLSAYAGGDVLVADRGHYALRLDGHGCDLVDFHSAVARGRLAATRGDLDTAADRLRYALGLWRGPALADAAGGFVDGARDRLESLRLDAVEALADADLARGDDHGVIRDLLPWLDREPDRERLYGQLMVALYRCGRTAEALGVFRRLRSWLSGGYGVEPGPDVQRLHRAILRSDDPRLVELSAS